MKRIVIATAMSLCVVSAAGKASGVDAVDPKIGTEITLMGCLHAGDESDSFVLVGVTERPALGEPVALVPAPLAIYWLDSTDGLKPLVGQLIDVTGKVMKREAKQGTITVDTNPEVRSDTVEVVSGDDYVKSKKYDNQREPAGTAGSSSTIVNARPVYQLDVTRVSAAPRVGPLGPACR